MRAFANVVRTANHYEASFFIQKLPKLPNAMGWGKLNRFYEVSKWMKTIEKNCFGLIPDQPLAKARITATRHSCTEPDRDNNYASLKPVIDSLRKNGFIQDDSPAHLELVANWQKESKRALYGLTIKIEKI